MDLGLDEGVVEFPKPRRARVQKVRLLRPVMELVVRNAHKACIGGGSQIHQAEERKRKLMEDQIVGQVGQAALSLYLTGHLDAYEAQRDWANTNPTLGDGGADILGSNLDVKTSKMRGSTDPLSYNLLVRPAERHPGWIYILALVAAIRSTTDVLLVGWASDDDLPPYPEGGGPFAGAFRIGADDLAPLPPVLWDFTRKETP